MWMFNVCFYINIQVCVSLNNQDRWNLFKSPSSIFSSSFSSPSTVQILPVPGLRSSSSSSSSSSSLRSSSQNILILCLANEISCCISLKWFDHNEVHLLLDIAPVPGRLMVPCNKCFKLQYKWGALQYKNNKKITPTRAEGTDPGFSRSPIAKIIWHQRPAISLYSLSFSSINS